MRQSWVTNRRRTEEKTMSHVSIVDLVTAAAFRSLDIEGLSIAYREPGCLANPKVRACGGRGKCLLPPNVDDEGTPQ